MSIILPSIYPQREAETEGGGRNSFQTYEFCQKEPRGRLIQIMMSWLAEDEVGLLLAQAMTWSFSGELTLVSVFISSNQELENIYWFIFLSSEDQPHQRNTLLLQSALALCGLDVPKIPPQHTHTCARTGSQENTWLYVPGCPEAYYVDQADLGIIDIHLLLPPECWD